MGRPQKHINEVALLDMRTAGRKLEEISKEMGISIPTLSRRIAVLKYEKGLLTKYRELQGLQLTELQARMLEAVEANNFENASLIELLSAFNILKKAELTIQGKGSFKVWGLTEHVMALEKAEKEGE
jgi:hypothetical protein